MLNIWMEEPDWANADTGLDAVLFVVVVFSDDIHQKAICSPVASLSYADLYVSCLDLGRETIDMTRLVD